MERNNLRIFLLLFVCFLVVKGAKKNGIEMMFYWREVIYEDLPLPDDTVIGKYPYHIPANNDVIGLAYHAKRQLMIATVGRLHPGVPSSLNAFCVNDYYVGTSPHLWAFPNYEKNTIKASFYDNTQIDSRKLHKKGEKYSSGYYNHFYEGQATYPAENSHNTLEDFSIISVYHPVMDEQCNRLFVIDTGNLYYGPNEIYAVQNPALIVFRITPETTRGWNGCGSREFPVIRRVEIPNHLWTDATAFAFLTLDFQPKGSCDDLFVYITNVYDFTLTVYDYKHNSFWAFKDPSMNPIIAESSMIFSDYLHYDFPFGITNLALGRPDKEGNRNAYYGPAASTAEYAVSTNILKTPPKRTSNKNKGDFTLLGNRGCNTQVFSRTIDPHTGVIFFGETQSKRILCWNTQYPLNPDTIGVIYESDALQFVSEIFMDAEGYLWFHSSHLPLFLLPEIPLDITDINSRTFRVKASDAIRGTVCDVQRSYQYHVLKDVFGYK
ncbi:L-dopachrome tautomerase yellow-f2-like [Phlebotomus argentipes]|uniref:L-dopachrome tautomerase yellow-f2-like n=1 Tax=Phlebotomus argentipes TaxID=94469 RepID=UPI0028936FFF|nr:L-dopachrome tautomerase yellow-f2-like [Phlebotomus argentipes]